MQCIVLKRLFMWKTSLVWLDGGRFVSRDLRPKTTENPVFEGWGLVNVT